MHPVVFKENGLGQEMYIVEEGTIRLSRYLGPRLHSPRIKRRLPSNTMALITSGCDYRYSIVLATLGRGSFFGEGAMQPERYLHTRTALCLTGEPPQSTQQTRASCFESHLNPISQHGPSSIPMGPAEWP